MEVDEEDEDGLKRYGHSKDKRAELPQIVIALMVTKEGIPVRCWVLAGNNQDMKRVDMVKRDLQGWKLSRCIWVMDRAMNSEENRFIFQKAVGHYIIGERLRDAHGNYKEAISCQGRYHEVRENLKVKEVIIGKGERSEAFYCGL